MYGDAELDQSVENRELLLQDIAELVEKKGFAKAGTEADRLLSEELRAAQRKLNKAEKVIDRRTLINYEQSVDVRTAQTFKAKVVEAEPEATFDENAPENWPIYESNFGRKERRLTPTQILNIKKYSRMGWTNKRIAEEYLKDEYTPQFVGMIIAGKRYTNVHEEQGKPWSNVPTHGPVSTQDRRLVKQMYATGNYTQAEIGSAVGLTQSAVSRIVNE